MCEKYNGWANRETWLVKLWIDNEQVAQSHALMLAKNAERRSRSALASSAAALLADDLEEWVGGEEGEYFGNIAEVTETATLVSDLLRHALGSVDWYDIAEAYLRDVEEE